MHILNFVGVYIECIMSAIYYQDMCYVHTDFMHRILSVIYMCRCMYFLTSMLGLHTGEGESSILIQFSGIVSYHLFPAMEPSQSGVGLTADLHFQVNLFSLSGLYIIWEVDNTGFWGGRERERRERREKGERRRRGRKRGRERGRKRGREKRERGREREGERERVRERERENERESRLKQIDSFIYSTS